MKIPYINLGIQHQEIKGEILNEIEKLLDSGQFILGSAVEQFEKEFGDYHNAKYALGVANGTDALILAMKALNIGEGDEVITAPNSFLASASSIALVGATPVFADVKADFTIDPEEVRKKITPRTKGIIVVHLTGRPADMDVINAIAKEHGIAVIEDAAQAVGAEYKGRRVGTIGDVGTFSLHPLKNLSACGDGGMVLTNNEELYNYMKVARNHGLKNRDECVEWNLNSRLDALQAAILSVKMKKIDEWTDRRREIANMYRARISQYVVTPSESDNEKAVYHTFIIQTPKRDELMKFLKEKGVDTKIHYPIPIHLQEAAKSLGYKEGDFPVTEQQTREILSLPVYPELTNEQIGYICDTIEEFFS